MNTTTPNSALAALLLTMAGGAFAQLPPEPASPEELVEALRSLNAIESVEAQAEAEAQAENPAPSPMDQADAIETIAPPAPIPVLPPTQTETAGPPAFEFVFPDADNQPTEPADVDASTVADEPPAPAPEPLPAEPLPPMDPIPIPPPTALDQPEPSVTATAPTPTPAEPAPSPEQDLTPVPVNNQPETLTRLPLAIDPRIAIATDHSIATLIAGLFETLGEINSAGHTQAAVSLLAGIDENNQDTALRFAQMFALMADEASADDDLETQMLLEQITAMQTRIATLEEAPAANQQTSAAPAAPTVLPEPPPPPRRDVTILPIAAIFQGPNHTLPVALLSINGNRHFIDEGDSIDDPNGDPVTLVNIAPETTDAGNEFGRITIEHRGRRQALVWDWETQ